MSEPKLTRRQQAELYLQDPNMRRYLDVLSFTEGTTKNGYHTKFGGGRWEDLSKHPNRVTRSPACLCQVATVASATDSGSIGVRISVVISSSFFISSLN